MSTPNEPPERDPDRAAGRAHPNPRQPASSANPILTAVIALVLRRRGAPAIPISSLPSPPSRRSPRPSQDLTRNQPRAPAQTADTQSLAPGPSSAQAADDLKQQIMSLSKRIDRLGERVDRLQELLSLAVPLLQRIAPKQ